MFSRDLREAVASGEITVSIRLWSRPKVKPGGRYTTAGVVIEIDSVELLPFSAVTVDRRLKDGDTVTLGGATLTARLTPGHTMGCTTWTFDTTDRGRTLHVVDLGGLSILDKTRVSGMPAYPGITKDYERTFATLKALPVDIFIGAHASYYGGIEKAAKAKTDPAGPNPFVDPAGFRKWVDAAERKFRDQLARERAGKVQ